MTDLFQPAAPLISMGNTATGAPIVLDSLGTFFVLDPWTPAHEDDGRFRLTLPTAVTFLGYALSLAWIAGGPWWMGLAGAVADEVDGRLARATNTTSKYGGELDYSVDLTLTGLSAVRTLGPWGLATLPLVTGVQAALHAKGQRPRFGSARTLFTALHLLRRA